MNSELHSNANRGNKDNHRDSTQLDTDQAHNAKQLYCHHSQDKNLRRKLRQFYQMFSIPPILSHLLLVKRPHHLVWNVSQLLNLQPPLPPPPPTTNCPPSQTQHWLMGLAGRGHNWADLSSPQISGQRQFEAKGCRRALPLLCISLKTLLQLQLKYKNKCGSVCTGICVLDPSGNLPSSEKILVWQCYLHIWAYRYPLLSATLTDREESNSNVVFWTQPMLTFQANKVLSMEVGISRGRGKVDLQ